MSREVQEQVLVRARRRCCVCYGLHRNSEVRRGQIAHINQDSSDNRLENLVFLCLEHHDEYDSSSSQSKGLTASEIRRFREELDGAIEGILSAGTEQDADAEVTRGPKGVWVREGFNEEGQIRIMPLSDGRYHVDAFALWGTDRPGGPNIGMVDFSVDLDRNVGVFVEKRADVESRMHLRFDGLVLRVETENGWYWGGMNVFFDGDYRKVSDDPFRGLNP